MGRPIHFEIHGSDPEALVRYYGELLGWKANRWGAEPYWLVETGEGPGINGAITQRRGPALAAGAPVMGAVMISAVEDIDAAFARGQQLGGTAALPKMAVPGMGWSAYLCDPDGNVFGLFQEDAEAK